MHRRQEKLIDPKVLLIIGLLWTVGALLWQNPTFTGRDMAISHVCFSPEENCQSIILEQIAKAEKEIIIQAYSFTDKALAQALLDKKNAGLEVKVLYDSSQSKGRGSQIKELTAAGISTKQERKSRGLAHNKVIIIDRERVITGSYNYSQAAKSYNSENLLVVEGEKLANEYLKHFQQRWLPTN
jgi:phosphatidylserine/phosphatidylglycerophosphate/cardiolipin synthase-like enzyme